jgi:hypothetical protein
MRINLQLAVFINVSYSELCESTFRHGRLHDIRLTADGDAGSHKGAE